MSEIDDFRARYTQHVGHVAAGDMKSAMAEMVQENLPTVFEGVDVPRGAIENHRIVGVRADGDRMIGEAVYAFDGREIGLRSIWERHDGTWLAAALENFPPGDRA
ncbi:MULTISPECIES: hypothetical protein [Gordonia]|uniref:SnoaL-like domain-containing protein n=1 Tax=Gordonia amicalis TaxID=89053 RepID=A0ABU4DDY5_9ACTN|nr:MULTISPECIES: hypothetical protein [Gordonia]ATD69375.1 hypothetical protein CNO18_02720 [Gordonia sp. 1D]MCR8898087.1 hypothetical protein [Gordonia sp. GONU]MDJ0451901.1 hypothetical protein [Gordonia amicalis]MDV6307956.1 hypothetical protein [Gordonia amicalis]MDV7076165.1 hypothetical protein [Gordonia amicalis]